MKFSCHRKAHVLCSFMQFRKSGEPFITHPVEVTRILAELKMDHESLIAGLLHDTVEDTENVKFEEIEARNPAASACPFTSHSSAWPARCKCS
jgi:(p)ppGpp synthase/HD superfamily hydrolase